MQAHDLSKEYKQFLKGIGVSKAEWNDPSKREVIVNKVNDVIKEATEAGGADIVDAELQSLMTKSASTM